MPTSAKSDVHYGYDGSVNSSKDFIAHGAELLPDGSANIRLIENPLLSVILNAPTWEDPNSPKANTPGGIVFKAENGVLVTAVQDSLATHTHAIANYDDHVKFTKFRNYLDHLVEPQVIKTALLHVGNHNELFKHDWARELPPLSMWAYLSFPIVKEAGSCLICKNIFQAGPAFYSSTNQFLSMPTLSFKGLVEHYYGTKSPRLIKALGKLIVDGKEVERVHLEIPQNDDRYNGFGALVGQSMLKTHGYNIIEKLVDGSYVVEGRPMIRNDFLLVGPALTKIMPLDLIQELFEYLGDSKYQEAISASMPKNPKAQRVPGFPNWNDDELDLFMQMQPRKRLDLIKDMMGGRQVHDDGSVHMAGVGFFRDLARMLNKHKDPLSIPESLRSLWPKGITLPKTKTLKEAHDLVAKWDNQIQEEKLRRPIEYGPHEKKVDGKVVQIQRALLEPGLDSSGLIPSPDIPSECASVVTVRNNYRIRLAESTTDLIRWGKELHNCIASYSDHAVNKASTFAALYEITESAEEILFGALEVKYERSTGYNVENGAIVGPYLGRSPDYRSYTIEDLLEDGEVRLLQCVENCNKGVVPELREGIEKAFKEALKEAIEEHKSRDIL